MFPGTGLSVTANTAFKFPTSSEASIRETAKKKKKMLNTEAIFDNKHLELELCSAQPIGKTQHY